MLFVTLVNVCLALPQGGASKTFDPPVRLEADGAPIQTDWFGHAAPALVDLDADGDLDLVVGQFKDGMAKVYTNVGTAKKPRYEYAGPLQANEENAKVPAS